MIILGINAYHADSSAAIFKNGELVAAIEEERFKRVKHWAGFPELSIAFCLEKAGVTINEVDHIAIGRDPKAKLIRKLLLLAKSPTGSLSVVKERFLNSKKVGSLDEDLQKQFPESTILKEKILQIEHHRSHLASAFFASPFKEAALLSIDGSGDFTTTMIGAGSGNKIEILDSVDFPHSLGFFYNAFTQFLGFNNYGDEYKVMGLASYGKVQSSIVDKLRKIIIKNESNGLFRLNPTYFTSPAKGILSYGDDHLPIVSTLFNKKIVAAFGLARKNNEPINQFHKDLAASVQYITEEIILHVLNHLQKRTGLKNVCIAGGVAQNSVANGKIISNTAFDAMYIPSAANDGGIAVGAALYAQHQIKNLPRQKPIYSAYTGTEYSNEMIESVLNSRNICYNKFSDEEVYDIVSDCLINSGVVGWFCGRSEFGPRALGARSILADPRRSDAKELLNRKIKRRENFRPFAPSILKEYLNEYFEANDFVPFMEKVLPIKKEKQSIIPAVTHVDGTGRLQTVDKEISPRFYKLIDKFRGKTGVPILLNTSFNENEPIVNSPDEAIDCFLRTNMDMLVLENCIIQR